MGFLDTGEPLPWHDSLSFLAYVREHGILQFLATYSRVKDRKNDVLLWGDEVEFHLVKLDEESKTAKICLKATSVLESLVAKEKAMEAEAQIPACSWRPEYGEWMVEATPARPFGAFCTDLLKVQPSMSTLR